MTDPHHPGPAMTTSAKAVLVVGAGDATGGAIARRFAREGYVACVARRSADKLEPLVQRIRAEGGQAHGFGSDARDEAAVAALVAQIEREMIRAALDESSGNISQTARLLGLTRRGLYLKLQRLGLPARV